VEDLLPNGLGARFHYLQAQLFTDVLYFSLQLLVSLAWYIAAEVSSLYHLAMTYAPYVFVHARSLCISILDRLETLQHFKMSNFQWGGYTDVNKQASQVQAFINSAQPAAASKSSPNHRQPPSNWKQTHPDRDLDRSGENSSLTTSEQSPRHFPPTPSSRQDASTQRQKSDSFRADILSAEKEQQASTEEITSEMDTDEDVPLAQLNSHADTQVQPVGKAKTPEQYSSSNRTVKPVSSGDEEAVDEATSESDSEVDGDSYADGSDREGSSTSTVQEEQHLIIPRLGEVYLTFEAFKTSFEFWHATTHWSSEELLFDALRLSVTCKRDNSHGCTFEIRLKTRKPADGFKIAIVSLYSFRDMPKRRAHDLVPSASLSIVTSVRYSMVKCKEARCVLCFHRTLRTVPH
jgi:hypothetical protein